MNDALKGRGCRWSDGSNGRAKCCWRDVDEAAFDEEDAFLSGKAYGGHSEAIVQCLSATERFEARHRM
jgi:DNA polymerase III subunit epsilon